MIFRPVYMIVEKNGMGVTKVRHHLVEAALLAVYLPR